MRNFLLTLLQLAVIAGKLRRPGGVRAVIAENLVLKQQLIVLRRGRLCGFASLFLNRGRIRKLAIALGGRRTFGFSRSTKSNRAARADVTPVR
jgi:hypothetical protein